jgi:hypothetical protein
LVIKITLVVVLPVQLVAVALVVGPLFPAYFPSACFDPLMLALVLPLVVAEVVDLLPLLQLPQLDLLAYSLIPSVLIVSV